GGAFSAETPATTPIILSGLANGTHSVAVAGKNSAGVYQVVNTLSRAWTVNTTQGLVRINEVLARNESAVIVNGKTPDMIELYNPEPVPADWSAVFLADSRRGGIRMHQVPPLSFVNGYGFTVLIADGNTNAGADHLDFQLSSDQGEIGLFDRNGSLIDCIVYG